MKKNPQKLNKYRGGTYLKKDQPATIYKTRRGKKVKRTLRDEKIFPRRMLASELAAGGTAATDAPPRIEIDNTRKETYE